MNLKEFVALHLIELTYLGVLAVLPFAVAQTSLGFLLLIVGIGAIIFHLFDKRRKKEIDTSGRGVLITGCDTGFGHALAKRLCNDGVVVFAGCLEKEGDGAHALTYNYGTTGRMHVLQMNVTKSEDVEAAKKYIEKMSEIELWCVVNNAAINFLGDIEFCTMEMYRRVAEVNLYGMVRVTKTLLPLVRKCKGRIVNVTSTKGRLTIPNSSVYSMAKFAADNFTTTLRLEMRKFGVQVVTIEPGNFGGSTGMLSKTSLKVMKRDYETMWNEASEDVQLTYSKAYLDNQYDLIPVAARTACPTISQVVDAMEEAVISEYPRIRYLIDGDRSWIDYNNWLLRLHGLIPESLMDYILDREHGSALPH